MFDTRIYIDPATKRGTTKVTKPCSTIIFAGYRPTTDRSDVPITKQSIRQSMDSVILSGLGTKPVTIKTTAIYFPGEISIEFTIHHTLVDDILTVEYETSNMQGGIHYLEYITNPSKASVVST